MQIVVTIDELTIRALKQLVAANYFGDSLSGLIMKDLVNGVVLPEGHGRLIDASVLHETLQENGWDDDGIHEIIDDSNTVVEAEVTNHE